MAHWLNTAGVLSPKKWWNVAKSVLGMHSNFTYPPIEKDNTILMNDEDKASAFNDFFLSQSRVDDSGIHLPDVPYNADRDSLDNIETSPGEVLDMLTSIKLHKATGPDDVSPRMLKEAAVSIAPSLSKLINMSLQKGIFPTIWKQANVIPVHKKNERHLITNYRPISLLSCTGKIMEKVVFKHLFNYIRDNELLSKFQSGFVASTSWSNCTTCLVKP